MKYLINVKETYRVDTEQEVEKVLEEAKASNMYDLSKYDCTYRETKQKGEVIDSWYRLTLVKTFTNEKEPDRVVNTEYVVPGGNYDNTF